MEAAPPPPSEDEVLIDDFEFDEEDPEELEPWGSSSDSEPERPNPPLRASPKPEPPALPPRAPMVEEAEEEKGVVEEAARPRWPGRPGASVFRLVVPADKGGAVIGHRGEAVQRLRHETRAHVHVFDPAHGAASRIVLVFAPEEVEAELSPAMDAAIKVFKRINGIEEINSFGTLSASAPEICSARLLVPREQALHLIGKKGVTINSIQGSTGAAIRIIDEDEVMSVESVDERIVDIRGAPHMVHDALKRVLELLRKFLVHHSALRLHLFQRKYQGLAQTLYTSKENQVTDDYLLAVNQDVLLSDQRSHRNPIGHRPLYGHDPSHCDPYSSDISQRSHGNPKARRFLCGRDPSSRGQYSPELSQPIDSLITKVTHTMQLALQYAEEIIGVKGENIEFIESVSGATVDFEEIGDYLEEVLIIIKGSPSQVQTAQELVQLGDGIFCDCWLQILEKGQLWGFAGARGLAQFEATATFSEVVWLVEVVFF
ncbi:hypothetical protein U9M48_026676 [Paspalum notatum var. saurae]|uniref:K Homology domain-containing protein n=1 Tax=Paspalum notatum var. saurae TaxID=547442 RepID=A0AAQ3TRE0_PASNO